MSGGAAHKEASATGLVRHLRTASHAELRQRIVEGHPVDPSALEGWVFRGTALGLPRVVEALTWKTFQKTFYRQPETGRLVGWNVRLHQDGVDAPSRPRMRRGVPVTTWHYEVTSPEGVPMPAGFDRGLVIDYGRGRNAALETIRLTKDPLVAVEPGNPDVLLGVSYLALGGACLETPTYFLLEREHRLAHVPDAARADGPARRPLLFGFERRWAEVLFAALLGLPSVDGAALWKALSASAPLPFGPGLRVMVHALTFLPLTLRGLRRPFFALSPAARLACVARLDAHPSVAVQQMLSTLKILACFAHFEDGAARAGVATEPARGKPDALTAGLPSMDASASRGTTTGLRR